MSSRASFAPTTLYSEYIYIAPGAVFLAVKRLLNFLRRALLISRGARKPPDHKCISLYEGHFISYRALFSCNFIPTVTLFDGPYISNALPSSPPPFPIIVQPQSYSLVQRCAVYNSTELTGSENVSMTNCIIIRTAAEENGRAKKAGQFLLSAETEKMMVLIDDYFVIIVVFCDLRYLRKIARQQRKYKI